MSTDGRLNFDTHIDSKGFEKGLDGLKSLASKGLGVIKDLTKAATAATVAIAGIGAKCIGIASDLTEVQNVVDVTFGEEGAKKINKWSKEMATAVGISELQAKQMSGTLGAMVKSMGLSDAAVMEMSTSLTELSGNFASFYNLDPEEAFEKIRSGISGETEPLKQLGINMSVVNLEAYAMSQGITKAFKDMTQGEQAILRYNYLLSVSKDAQGDFTRTSDTLANQLRILKLNVTDLSGEIGATLVPMAQEALGYLNNMISDLKEAFNEGGFEGLANSIGDALADVITKASEYLPKFIDMGIKIVQSLLDGLSNNRSQIVKAGLDIAESLIGGVVDMLPDLIQLGGDILGDLCKGLESKMPNVVDKGFEIIRSIMKGANEQLTNILSLGLTVIKELARGIKENLPDLMVSATETILSFVDYLLDPDNIDEILDCAGDILEALADGLIKSIGVLLEKAPMIIEKLAEALIKAAVKLYEVGQKINQTIADSIMNYDWEALGENIANAINRGMNAAHGFVDWLLYGEEANGEDDREFHGGGRKFDLPDDTDRGKEKWDIDEPQEKLEKAVEDTGEVISDLIETGAAGLENIVEEETKKIADIESNLLYKKSDDLIALEKQLKEKENREYEKELASKERIGIKAIQQAYKRYTDAEVAAIKVKEAKVAAIELKQQGQSTLLKNAQAMAEVDEAYKTLTKAELKAIADKSEDTQKLNLDELMNNQKEITVEQLKATIDRYKQLEDIERENLEGEKKIQEEMLKSYESTYSSLISEYQNAYDTISNKQESLANKFKAFGDLFEKVKLTINEKGDQQEFMKLGNLQEDVQQLKLLSEGIEKLRQRGVSQGFLDNYLSTQSVEDSLDYTELLLAQNDETLSSYLSAWEEKNKLAEQLSSDFYQSEYDALKEKFTDKINDELNLMPDEAEKIGQETAMSLAEGLRSGVDTVRNAVGELVAQMKAAVMTETLNTGATLATNSTVTQNVQTKDNGVIGALGAILSVLSTDNDPVPIMLEMDGKKVGEGSIEGTIRELKRRGVTFNGIN